MLTAQDFKIRFDQANWKLEKEYDHSSAEGLKSVAIDRVVAKAECVSGLNPGYMNPHPASWIDARSLGVNR